MTSSHDITERPWSQSDMERLREALRLGAPILHIATSLQRDIGSIRGKIAELTTLHNRSLQARHDHWPCERHQSAAG